jgi:mRNA interferase MazF
MENLKRGEIWWVNFEPSVGTEIKKIRPALIISNNLSNKSGKKFTVIPITSKVMESPVSVNVEPDSENCLKNTSSIKIPEIATFDKLRFKTKIGILSSEKIREVEEKLKQHLGLK